MVSDVAIHSWLLKVDAHHPNKSPAGYTSSVPLLHSLTKTSKKRVSSNPPAYSPKRPCRRVATINPDVRQRRTPRLAAQRDQRGTQTNDIVSQKILESTNIDEEVADGAVVTIKTRSAARGTKSSVIQSEQEPQRGRHALRTRGIAGRQQQHNHISQGQELQLLPTLSSSAALNGAHVLRPLSPSRSQSSSVLSGHTQRSRSPVKNMADLRIAGKRVLLATRKGVKDFPEDVRSLHKHLAAISEGIRTVPERVQEYLGDDTPFLDHHFREDDGTKADQVQLEFRELVAIQDQAIDCKDNSASEAAWNDEVHSRLLRLALNNFVDVKHHNVTTAAICSQLAPVDVGGEYITSRQVDYTINMVPPADAMIMIDDLLDTQPSELRTVTQTLYTPVRNRPCAVSVETKIDSTEEPGKVQLTVWSYAHFARLRHLFATQGPIQCPTHPVILTNGHTWKLFYVRDSDDHMEMFGEIVLGETRTLVGLYKLLAALRALAQWGRDYLLGLV